MNATDTKPDLLSAALAPAIATLVVVSTGLMYFAGYAYEASLLRSFGFNAGIIDTSIQDTLTIGFVLLIDQLFYLIAFMAAIVLVLSILYAILTKDGLWIISGQFKAIADNRWYFVFLFCVSLYFLAEAAGQYAAYGRSEIIRQASTANCRGCSTYDTGTERVRGELVAQDHDRSLVFDGTVTKIIINDELVAVSGGKPKLPGLSRPLFRLRSWFPSIHKFDSV